MTETGPSAARAEREDLVAVLRAADPAAATLCRGWTVQDLTAHLVMRERRMDATLMMAVPVLRRWSERVRDGYARRPPSELIDLLAAGPPRWTLFAVPGMDDRLNVGEFFVHAEDVRRGVGGGAARDLPAWRSDALWKVVRTAGRLLYRSSPVGVTLRRPDGEDAVVRNRTPMVVVVGEPGELLLHAFGRAGAAHVDLLGDPADVARLP